MAKRAKATTNKKKAVESYDHKDKKRANNPPVGLVTPETDPDKGKKKTYQYDPHTIIAAVRRNGGSGQGIVNSGQQQMLLFEQPEQNPPLREAIEFYKHAKGWTNRLIAGDSLLVMNSLLEKEGMAGKVQMVYIDPPYGIRYGSNFQPFVNKRDVSDGKDDDLTQEPEMIRAFRDTWQLGIHSYLASLRDRLLLARALLHESGSCIVQISTENLHRVSLLLDEVFGANNLVEVIAFRKKTMPLGGRLLEGICDYLIWYARDKEKVKYRPLFQPTPVEGDSHWNLAIEEDGQPRRMTKEEVNNHKLLPRATDIGQLIGLYPAGSFRTGLYDFPHEGKTYSPPPGWSWKTPVEGMQRLSAAGRLVPYSGGATLRYLLRHSDYPVSPLSNAWGDTSAPSDMRYVVGICLASMRLIEPRFPPEKRLLVHRSDCLESTAAGPQCGFFREKPGVSTLNKNCCRNEHESR